MKDKVCKLPVNNLHTLSFTPVMDCGRIVTIHLSVSTVTILPQPFLFISLYSYRILIFSLKISSLSPGLIESFSSSFTSLIPSIVVI